MNRTCLGLTEPKSPPSFTPSLLRAETQLSGLFPGVLCGPLPALKGLYSIPNWIRIPVPGLGCFFAGISAESGMKNSCAQYPSLGHGPSISGGRHDIGANYWLHPTS